MNRETLYALLAGCASFILIAYGSYWYFSPAKPTGNPVMENGSSPAKAAGAISADKKEPTPIVVQPAAPDNASPLAAAPSRSAPPTPTAYGSAIGAGPQTAAPSFQTMQDRKVTRAERRRRRLSADED